MEYTKELMKKIMTKYPSPDYEIKKVVMALVYYSNTPDKDLSKTQLKRKPLIIEEAKQLLGEI